MKRARTDVKIDVVQDLLTVIVLKSEVIKSDHKTFPTPLSFIAIVPKRAAGRALGRQRASHLPAKAVALLLGAIRTRDQSARIVAGSCRVFTNCRQTS